MEQIALYLKKFTTIIPREKAVREHVVDILKQYSESPISMEDIHLKRNTLFIKASPLLKNILFMYKKDVLQQLHHRLEKVSISDIR